MFQESVTPIRVISSYRLLSSPLGVVTRQRGRKCWGLALKAGGQTVYNQDGKTFLSDKNHVMLLPKGAQYEWTCTDQGECIVIDFDALEEGTRISSLEVGDNGFFLTAFSKIDRILSLEDEAGRLEAMQLLYGLLAQLARMAPKPYIPRGKQQLLTPAVEHMMDNYADPEITNDRLAALCAMSTVYFRKTFEAVYGTPPIRYLHELRLGKAKAILQGDYDSIGQVAQSVGYSSVYHFSKMFRHYTGQSPTAYAKQAREEKG